MPIPLYLDAARMGVMSPSAQLALQDFVRFAGETHCTLYFDSFWPDGIYAVPSTIRNQFPGLSVWNGIHELKNALRSLAGAGRDCPAYLAGRSSSMVKRVCSVLSHFCRRALITDLTWPRYARLLRREMRKRGRTCAVVPIRRSILVEQESPVRIIQKILREYTRQGCDAVFLPEVSHEGVRLPIVEISQTLRAINSESCVVIDGAQAFGHVPIASSVLSSDCYLVGVHKWIGAHLPLSVAFTPRRESSHVFRHRFSRIDDPLADFVASVESGHKKRFGETANLTPLLACRGALSDVESVERDLAIRKENVLGLTSQSLGRWKAILPHEDFRAGILLLRCSDPNNSARVIRSQFAAAGIALSAYDGGVIRIAAPKVRLASEDVAYLSSVFRQIGTARPAGNASAAYI